MTKIERLGDRALRISRPANADPARLLAIVRAWPGVVDASLTEHWVAAHFADGISPDASEAMVESLAATEFTPARGREIEIAVRYDGRDLDAVAHATGRSPDDIARDHMHAEYTVLFLGFLPGFAYLGGLPRALEIPRRASPRTRVPKNAVAIGGPYTGIYPFESPGGWNIIATALDVKMFDASSGSFLRAGDRVRFVRP